MHMSDALVSPAVGATMWAATAALTVASARRLQRDPDERRPALMGVLGAFVFAAQMINFTIPGTGSSGHLGGGLLLAALLGPHAAFLVLASVLAIQALFFADGGLLALGANLFNMGFFTTFVAYPFVFRPVAGAAPGRLRLTLASVAAAVVGLALGALGVVAETALSGISTLPLGTFVALMVPIHLAIGVGEGLVTAVVLAATARIRTDLARAAPAPSVTRRVLVGLGVTAVLVAGLLSWFASVHPDGLEWSLARAGFHEAGAADGVHALLARIQEATAFLPDYGFRGAAPSEEAWPAPSGGTSVAGIVGAGIVLAFAAGLGLLLRALRRRAAR